MQKLCEFISFSENHQSLKEDYTDEDDSNENYETDENSNEKSIENKEDEKEIKLKNVKGTNIEFFERLYFIYKVVVAYKSNLTKRLSNLIFFQKRNPKLN